MAITIINIIAIDIPAYMGTLFEFCKSQNGMSCFKIKILNEKKWIFQHNRLSIRSFEVISLDQRIDGWNENEIYCFQWIF